MSQTQEQQNKLGPQVFWNIYICDILGMEPQSKHEIHLYFIYAYVHILEAVKYSNFHNAAHQSQLHGVELSIRAIMLCSKFWTLEHLGFLDHRC